MLDGIETIDWAALEDAYGPVVEMPERLRALTTEDWERAIGELYAGIFHQGSYYSASACVVPFLIEISMLPGLESRASILTLLAAMTSSHDDDEMLVFDPYAFRSQPGPPDYPEAKSTIDAIAAGAPVFVRLIDDEDAAVRAAAAYLVAGVPAAAKSAREKLEARIAIEPDHGAHASQLLALGRLGVEADVFRRDLDHPAPLVRHSAAVASAWRETLDPLVLRLLAAAAAAPFEEARFPWSWVGIAPIAIATLARLHEREPDAARDALGTALATRLARGERALEPAFPSWNDWAEEQPQPMPRIDERAADTALRGVAAAYAPLVFARFADRFEDPALPDELVPFERALLSRTTEASLPLPIAGIPWVAPSMLRRYLRGDSGPLEQSLTVGDRTLPIWKWLYLCAGPTLSDDEARAVADALCDTLSSHELLDLAIDIASRDYAHPSPTKGAHERQRELSERIGAVVNRDAAKLEPRLRELASELVRINRLDNQTVAFVLEPLVGLLSARGEVLDESLDELMRQAMNHRDRALARALLSTLPVDRRSRLLADATAPRLRELRDLCDDALVAQTLIERFVAPTWTRGRHEVGRMLRELGRACEPHLSNAIERTQGRKRRFLEEIRNELGGAKTEHLLEIAATDSGLSTVLTAPDGSRLCECVLPTIPKREDIEPIVAKIADLKNAMIRMHAPDVEHTIRYRLQRLISQLGAREVSVGGSSIGRR